jgi:iron-sulfur cluster insertion protein
MITITESARNKIADIIAEENNPDMKLRMFVQGGGCSGFSYGFTLDEMKNEDDFEFEAGITSVLVDAMSAQYLQGAKVDYKEDLMGAEFKISNPNAQSTCGCGSSFSPN